MLKRLKKNGFSLKDDSILGDVFNFSDKSSSFANVSSVFNEEAGGAKKSKSGTEDLSMYKILSFSYIINS